MELLKEVILINGYWFSLPITGFGLLLLLREWLRGSKSRLATIVGFALRQHIFTQFFLSFAFMVLLLGVVAIFCYLVHAPAIVLTIFYVALLLTGVSYLLTLIYKALFKKVDIDLFGLRNQTLLTRLVFLGLGVLLVADFALALYVKSYALVSADTYVHLSRIMAILSQGFTVESGFFNNLPETGYHLNIVYALHTIPAQVLGLQPSDIWEYSFGFFRLLQWMAIFTLAWHVCRYWVKDSAHALFGATLATISAILCLGGFFFTAPYPNQVVSLWLTLLVIGVSFYERRVVAAQWAVWGAAFLITTTHALSAVMAVLFIGIMLLLRFVFERRALLKKETIIFYGATIGILLLGPLRTWLFPNHLTDAALNIGAFDTLSFGPLAIKEPPHIWHWPPMEIILLLLGTGGFVFLLYRLWAAKRQWAIACALIIFYPLLVYVPFTFGALKSILPLWAIDRLTGMNVLSYIAIPLGIYGILSLTKHWQPLRRTIPDRFINVRMASVVAIILVLGIGAYCVRPALRPVFQTRDQNNLYYAFMDRTYADFHKILIDEKVVVANTGDSYFFASILPVDVIAIEEGHTTPTADAVNRLKCQEQLMRYFNYSDLATVKASYVVLAKYDKPLYNMQRMIADARPYLQAVAQNQEFYLYEFKPSKQDAAFSGAPFQACTKFQETERE